MRRSRPVGSSLWCMGHVRLLNVSAFMLCCGGEGIDGGAVGGGSRSEVTGSGCRGVEFGQPGAQDPIVDTGEELHGVTRGG